MSGGLASKSAHRDPHKVPLNAANWTDRVIITTKKIVITAITTSIITIITMITIILGYLHMSSYLEVGLGIPYREIPHYAANTAFIEVLFGCQLWALGNMGPGIIHRNLYLYYL